MTTSTRSLALLLILAGSVQAEVMKLEITERASFADGHHFGNVGPYERVKGWLRIELDPRGALHLSLIHI